MKGLEICEKYYRLYGESLFEKYPELMRRAATGLVGEGSECLGFDDEISRDHDFDFGFCIWLTDEDERDYGFALSRAYASLPKEFMGLKRAADSPVGGSRRGVMTIGGFYQKFLGGKTVPDELYRWLYIPSYALSAATNGKVFYDGLGSFSQIREQLKKGYPEDIRRKKIASNLVMMAQTGQYNYVRCVKRGETGAAGIAIAQFVRHALSVIYLLNGVYEPFYKWVYRGLRDLPILSDLELTLTGLTELGNTNAEAEKKSEIIDDTANLISQTLKEQRLISETGIDLESFAYCVNDTISDCNIRNMHIMEGL